MKKRGNRGKYIFYKEIATWYDGSGQVQFRGYSEVYECRFAGWWAFQAEWMVKVMERMACICSPVVLAEGGRSSPHYRYSSSSTTSSAPTRELLSTQTFLRPILFSQNSNFGSSTSVSLHLHALQIPHQNRHLGPLRCLSQQPKLLQKRIRIPRCLTRCFSVRLIIVFITLFPLHPHSWCRGSHVHIHTHAHILTLVLLRV